MLPKEHLQDIDHVADLSILIVGVWGAIMNFFKRDIKDYSWKRKIFLFLFDIISSAGIAIIVFLIIQGYYHNELLAVGLAGFFAHQGTRAFYYMEHIVSQVIKQKLHIKLDEGLSNDNSRADNKE